MIFAFNCFATKINTPVIPTLPGHASFGFFVPFCFRDTVPYGTDR